MNRKAFTLTELIGTIVILGVVLMIAVPSYNSYIEKSKERKCDADRRAILDAAETFVNDCIYNNVCSTTENLSDYVDSNNLKVSDLTSNNNFLDSSKYSKYNDIEIEVRSNGNEGYEFEIANENDFMSNCK